MDSLKPDDEDELVKSLEELGRRERDERRAADELSDTEPLPDARRILADVWAAEDRARAPRRWPIVTAVLAAAAAIFVAWILFRPPAVVDPGRPTGEVLNDGVFRIHPPGSLANGWPERVRWGGPDGVAYTLRVLSAPEQGEGSVLLGPRRIEGFELRLLPEWTAQWPDRIKIEVTYRRKDGTSPPPATDSWSLQR